MTTSIQTSHPTTIWYADNDGDGFGNPNGTTQSCTQPNGYIQDNNDCDDGRSQSYPNAPELCDGLINTCGGSLPVEEVDFDGDFYVECSIDVNGWLGAPVIQGGDDCDNNNADLNPGATEIWYDGIDQDCSGGTDYDQDGDGQDSADYNGIDCDDTDASIYLGANDAWYDGVDSNCDGANDFDQDGDGFMSDQHSGEDCDDLDANINPGSLDDQGDGIDQNCDGYADEALLPTVDALQLGDLIITEVMQNPDNVNDVDGEWFEIYNSTSDSINLNGLSVSDNGSDSFTVNRTLVIEAADYLVFGKNADSGTNGGVDMDYSYGSQMTLSNSDDEIILENDLGLVDMIAWDNGQTFPDPTGTSMNLDPTYYTESDNDNGSNWCESTTVLVPLVTMVHRVQRMKVAVGQSVTPMPMMSCRY